MSLYSKAKNTGLALADSVGLFQLVERSSWRHHRLLILCYHGISLDDEHIWHPGLYLDAPTFRRRLEFLRDGGYHVLPLNEGIRLLALNSLPTKSVAITFDDGMYDFYVHARPLLEEFGFPATLYLTTYYCINQLPIFDPYCYYLLWKGRGRPLNLTGLLPEGGYVIVPSNAAGVRALYQSFYNLPLRNQQSAAAKDEFLRLLASRLNLDDNVLRTRRMITIMNPEEVRQTAASGLISIELHTHRHRTPRDRDLFRRELTDNASIISDITGRQARHFCYPSGDYDNMFLPWLGEFGVKSATTCITGLAASHHSPLLLPRLLDMPIRSVAEFRGWLSGFNTRILDCAAG